MSLQGFQRDSVSLQLSNSDVISQLTSTCQSFWSPFLHFILFQFISRYWPPCLMCPDTFCLLSPHLRGENWKLLINYHAYSSPKQLALRLPAESKLKCQKIVWEQKHPPGFQCLKQSEPGRDTDANSQSIHLNSAATTFMAHWKCSQYLSWETDETTVFFSTANPQGCVTFHSLRGQLQSSSEAGPRQKRASRHIWCMVSPTLLLSVALCKERCCRLSATVNYSSLEGTASSLKSKIIWKLKAKLDSKKHYFPASESEILHNSTSSAQLPFSLSGRVSAQNYASEQFRATSQATLIMQVRKITASGYVLKPLA